VKPEPLVAKPASGHWIDAYPELGRQPISLDDSVSVEFYEKEREHVFKKSWLYMGRVEQLPQKGCYFTRELKVLDTSILVVRGKDDSIRAFHNMCAHRGNKLVWQDDPFQETRGQAPLLFCRFHGWRYNLDGSLIAPTRKDLLYDFDARKCGLPAIQCEVWEGFIFINLNADNKEPVRAFLGELAHGVEGYPFSKLPKAYAFKVELNCNWKIFMDGFAEGYHTPYLHGAALPNLEQAGNEASNALADALAIQLKGLHRLISWAGPPAQKSNYSTPTECVVEAGATGLWNKADLGPLPAGINPGRSEHWGVDSFQFFPNFVLVFWSSGCYTTHAHWPTGPHSHSFELVIYFREPQDYKERLGQEMTVNFLNDVILQDTSPLEGMQAMLNSRGITEFHVNDEELLVRHLHKVVADYIHHGETQKRGKT
jgi:phenylpropionate dioxygenase-like ring-hydroxylating dioxygenase large terminal subunit